MKENKKKIMGFILTLVMFIGCLSLNPIATYAEGDVAINETNFPDNNFRAYVKNKFDTDNNEVLSQEERDNVKNISVPVSYIISLKGIEFFKNLESLDCSTNSLTELNLSKNTALSQLNCSGNELTNLDLSKNTALTKLDCKRNQLTSLDVSKNIALTKLDCKRNQLTSLDVSKNIALTKLDCKRNQLTSLDVSKNIALTDLNCAENQLTNLDLSKNTALTKLSCDRNQLTNLDLSNNTKLKELSCSFNLLTKLDLSKNTELQILECGYNQLTSLDVSKNTALTKLDCPYNELTSLDLSGYTALKDFECYGNELTNLDVSGDTALEKLKCSNDQLTSLDVSGDTALKDLECDNNQLTNLDVSDNPALEYLNCDWNQLTNLDLSKNIALTKLECPNNQLTSLDVSGHIALKNLNCYNNQLTSLDVSGDTVLNELQCFNNQLTSLDLSGYTALKKLYCSNNQLTSLDLSGDTALKYFECHGNELTSLDLSGYTALEVLYCQKNPLTYVKLPDRDFYKESSPITYTVKVAEGSSKIPFTALPQGFDKKRIKADSVEGTSLEEDGFKWNKSTGLIRFKYKLWDKPETNDAKLREADDEESGFVDAELRALLEVVGPVDPTKPEGKNPDTNKYWTVSFESEDESKGTVAAENTFYVLKTGGKTLADLKDKAPATTSKAGYEFDKWDPALDKSTAINKDITVKAYFKKESQPTPAPKPNPPIEYKRNHTPSIPVIVNVAKTMKLNVKLIIGSKEMIKSVDGVEEKIMMDVAPFIENGRTMLPIRFVAEALGFNVKWDKDSRTVILIDKENVVKIPVDTNKIIVNEKEYTSDVKPVIKNDRTMLPIANIARALGLKDGKDIHWNEGTKEVIITREIVK